MYRPVTIAEAGVITAPALHDAKIVSITFGQPALTLSVLSPENLCISLRFFDVKHLSCTDLAEQNIILDFWVEQSATACRALVDRAAPGPTAQQELYRENLRKLLTQGHLRIWRISPSYGADLAILAARAEFDIGHEAA